MTKGLSCLLVLATLLAVVLAACADRAAPRFPHQLHLAGLDCGAEGKPACLTCNSCHAVSKRDRAHKLPENEVCANCHHEDAHEILPILKTEPHRVSGKIRFDHDRHLAMRSIQGQCVPCHAGVVKASSSTMPPMSECFSCHEHKGQFEKGVCAPCHVRADLERTLPKSFLVHDASFMRHHGQLAQ